ncbi:serine/threonine protein kinase [Yamadazyma tenuis]|uniref:Pkinase-domain-containing protein n=1 Tax=Candida tenuis (strain ATCC 10573 / BCRC 21748 / CBS 615 / JCM 9827 / NBRC 10315 / NRRL Y-1498 / VKM Y-70) TaxID=590646 RepID=G3B025_CANTC|nr:uncharacterized protein CANTEDRAFT_119503 [Yamadazyma tenuis ATCC 10573]EGV65296.1 hypothetical protein CANTEDRAFT_119503 [Yamadazyma tenuis ATCC 10573]WEJ95046.1 serine/threonine protein kinase [Yamadazyma tenuis]
MSLNRKRAFGEEVDELRTVAAKRQELKYEIIANMYNTDQEQSHISLSKKPSGLLIGRSSQCDIRISGVDVSSKHSKLSLATNQIRDYFFVTDLSSNGTYVNGEKLGHGTSVLLKSGDHVSFAKTGGAFIFRYCADEKETAHRKRSLFDDYVLGKQLGAGHYAVVKEARNRLTGDIVAVKIFHPNKTSKNSKDEEAKLQQEIDLLLSIDHPNIVKFISRYVEPVSQHTMSTFLVLEKVNSGELFQRIINKSKLREDETKGLFKQLLSGLLYLHENNIIHRDIKPENILLDITPRRSSEQVQTGPWDHDEYDIRVKIADFGLAKFIGELKFTNTLCGTPAYVAPEILSDQRNYSTKADIWSSGVLLYVCLCGFPPFSDELGPPTMREQILSARYAFYSPYWDDITDPALDLISSLLVLDPDQRFDVHQTISHDWLAQDTLEDKDMEDVNMDAFNSLKGSIKTNSMRSSSMLGSETDKLRTPVRSSSQPIRLRDRFASELNSIDYE